MRTPCFFHHYSRDARKIKPGRFISSGLSMEAARPTSSPSAGLPSAALTTGCPLPRSLRGTPNLLGKGVIAEGDAGAFERARHARQELNTHSIRDILQD